MNQSRRSTTTRRRLGAVMTGLGTATGGLLLAAFSQLALGPTAQAQPDDPFTDIAAAIQASIANGTADFNIGAADFANGSTSLALAYDLAGLDNQVFGTGLDVTANGIEALTGSPESGEFPLSVVDVSDGLAAGITEAEHFISDGSTSFASGFADFAAGDVIDGVESNVYGLEVTFIDAPNAIILGLADSLFGGATATIY
jgi:hypothetical protein